MELLENKTFDEIQIGDSASLVRTLTKRDIELFAVLSGDLNPTHLDEDYARQAIFHQVVAPSLWGGMLISGVRGTFLPGPGTVYQDQSLSFAKPVRGRGGALGQRRPPVRHV